MSASLPPEDLLSDGDLVLGGDVLPSAVAPSATQAAAAVVYDFRRPHRISKERLRSIEAMYGGLAKSLEAWMIGRLRRQISLRLHSVEQLSFGEFALSLPVPCASFGFDIRDSGGRKGVIDVGHELAYLLVDRFFGGRGDPLEVSRALTPIERLAVRIVVERITTLLTEIWHGHASLDLELTTFESFPEMVQAANPGDPVLVGRIEVVTETQTSLVLVCLPFAVLDTFFASSDRQGVKDVLTTEPERRIARENAEASVRLMNVDIAARLPTFSVPMRQLLGLPVGALLTTGLPTDTAVDVLVNGELRYHAASGRVGQQLAVRLVETPAPLPPLSNISPALSSLG